MTPHATPAPDARTAPLAAPTPMTVCACTGRTFAEVAARVVREGPSSLDAERLTGCGSLCTACLPDLRSFLAGRRP